MNPHLDQEVSVSNAITGAQYLLQPIWKLEPSSRNLEAITAICNEALVYQWCFRELCSGIAYPLDLAADWLRWGTEGWKNNTHFVYVVTDADGAVAAACDIKGSNLERAEIGYWSGKHHRGIMTNAVRSVIQLADEAGFKVLFADIHPDNRRSLAVIQRCGFAEVDRQPTIPGHTPFERIHPNSGQDASLTVRQSPRIMNPFSRALLDFHAGSRDAAFTIRRDDGFTQRVPAATFFETEQFPPLELLAMGECRGRILDVGSAAGRHSLELLRRGNLVTSLDILPEMGAILKDRGQPDVIIADVMKFSAQKFDTILMLMNGIGMVGGMGGLREFLRHAHELVLSGGRILCDSIDVSITTDPRHMSYRERNLASGRPGGQQFFTMECEGEEPVAFDWLHIDFESLARVASSLGWKAEMLQEQNDGHYLCRLSEDQE